MKDVDSPEVLLLLLLDVSLLVVLVVDNPLSLVVVSIRQPLLLRLVLAVMRLPTVLMAMDQKEEDVVADNMSYVVYTVFDVCGGAGARVKLFSLLKQAVCIIFSSAIMRECRGMYDVSSAR